MAVGAALRLLLAELAARDRHMCAAAAFVGIDVVLDRSMMGVLSTSAQRTIVVVIDQVNIVGLVDYDLQYSSSACST